MFDLHILKLFHFDLSKGWSGTTLSFVGQIKYAKG